ncbi:hypothetical protein GCM10023314_11330 [Algibacter agarivorans]|uniref:MetA-pathway of phenol degradation n=1 Tax=Algibacter agarivorans TaxID=1109741 RepID=A0ABP9GEE3_9FLAO
MMNSKKILFVIILAFLFSNSVFSQWTKEKGKGYYKLSAWYLEADQHYTDTGETDPNITRSQFNISFYGEYGISNKFDVITYIPFFSRAVENDEVSGTTGQIISKGEAFNSFGDVEIGLRYGILKTSNYALSATLKLGIPTGDNSGGSDGSFQTGDGEFNQLLQTNLGTSFNLGTIPSYAKTYLGFNNRTNGFSDELRAGLEIGSNILKDKLWIIGRVDILESLRNGELSAQNSQGSIFANNIEYVSLGAEIAYYITKKVGVSFNYTGAVSGKLVYAAPSISGGIFLDIK